MLPDQLSPSLIADWLAAKAEEEGVASAEVTQLQAILGQLYVQAIQRNNSISLDGALQHGLCESRRDVHERSLSCDEIARIELAAESSANPKLKFIVALLILTGVRQRDLLEACWEQFDLDEGIWIIPSVEGGTERRVELSREAIDLVRQLPHVPSCPYVLANSVTRKPYRSFSSSWDTARLKAGLADVEIDDLRFCTVKKGTTVTETGSAVKTSLAAFIARGRSK